MSSLQNKLNNYEVVPPANVWDKVAAALDESASGSEFPSRLYNAEVAPPAAVWENIQSELNPQVEETKVIPLRRRTPSFLRYAVAAALIGFAAFGIIRFTASTSPESTIASGGNPADTSSSEKKDDNTQNMAQQEELPVKAPDSRDLLITQVVPVAKKDARKSNAPRIASAIYTYSEPTDIDPLYDYADPAPNVVDRYIMMMTPEGNIIRMSKKLGNLVCCVSGEEQDADCKSQLKKWQEKLATSPADASSGNFLDILTLVNSLEQGTEL